MALICTPDAQVKLSQARRLMSEVVLNGTDIGTHLGLALCRIENHFGVSVPGIEGARELKAKLEKQFSKRLGNIMNRSGNPTDLMLSSYRTVAAAVSHP